MILASEVPNKILFGKNISYDHLHVFGCKAFVHIPRDERFKLDAKIRQYIFIGYGEMNLATCFMILLRRSLLKVVTYNS